MRAVRCADHPYAPVWRILPVTVPRTVLALLLVVAAASPAAAEHVVARVDYACAGGKTIEATYYADKVAIVLSDGRSLTLPQTLSGSGIRYANADESVVFWSKGNDAFVTEGDPDKPTYADCVGKRE